MVENERTGKLEVYFELPAASVDRAFNEARGRYGQIAKAAGFAVPELLDMTISGFEALLLQASRDRQLLDRARELMQRDEHELAVILAQTACEVLIADALRSLLHPHVSDEMRPWLVGQVRSYTLRDDSTRDLWNRLTRSAIHEQDFWAAYKAHVERRNQIVHSGDRVDADAAQLSLDAATRLFAYVEQTVGAMSASLAADRVPSELEAS